MSGLDLLRYSNILLGFVIGGVFLGRLVRRWWALPTDARQERISLIVLMLATGYGSAEAIHQSAPNGTRTAIFTAGLVLGALSCIPRSWKRRVQHTAHRLTSKGSE